MSRDGKRELDRAFERLEDEVPDPVSRALRWLRDPKGRAVRLAVGLLCIAGGFFWFLPVLGLELFPIGLLLIAQDVPFLRKPVARSVLWLEDRWRGLRRRWERWRRERQRGRRPHSQVRSS